MEPQQSKPRLSQFDIGPVRDLHEREARSVSTWNHRVVRREYPKAVPEERILYGVHEAYYDSEGVCFSVTRDPTPAYGATLDEVRRELERMLAALEKPVLDYETREEIPE